MDLDRTYRQIVTALTIILILALAIAFAAPAWNGG